MSMAYSSYDHRRVKSGGPKSGANQIYWWIRSVTSYRSVDWERPRTSIESTCFNWHMCSTLSLVSPVTNIGAPYSLVKSCTLDARLTASPIIV